MALDAPEAPEDAVVDPQSATPAEFLELAKAEIAKAVVGHEDAIEGLFTGILARGHVLLEGPPGTAKTLLARSVARIVGGRFSRVQFTRDTTPTEILGEVVRRGGVEELDRGPIFTNVFLADEINRAQAETQAALLEAMQERHVTLRGRTYWIDSPFMVVATQNPYEHEGVFPLAESQLDRFLLKIDMSYGTVSEELAMLELPHRGVVADVIGDIYPLLADGRLLRMQDAVDAIRTPREILERVTAVVRRTRIAAGVELGASPRSAIHVLATSRARALLDGRDAVEPGDVDAAAMLVLPHRILARDPRRAVEDAIASASRP